MIFSLNTKHSTLAKQGGGVTRGNIPAAMSPHLDSFFIDLLLPCATDNPNEAEICRGVVAAAKTQVQFFRIPFFKKTTSNSANDHL